MGKVFVHTHRRPRAAFRPSFDAATAAAEAERLRLANIERERQEAEARERRRRTEQLSPADELIMASLIEEERHNTRLTVRKRMAIDRFFGLFKITIGDASTPRGRAMWENVFSMPSQRRSAFVAKRLSATCRRSPSSSLRGKR